MSDISQELGSLMASVERRLPHTGHQGSRWHVQSVDVAFAEVLQRMQDEIDALTPTVVNVVNNIGDTNHFVTNNHFAPNCDRQGAPPEALSIVRGLLGPRA